MAAIPEKIHDDVLAPLPPGVPKIRYVQIQTHSRCNADCVFCPYSESWHAQNPGRMSDALFEKILDDLAPFGATINDGKVCPYLMQEPLIDPKIFERIERIYDAFPGTLVEISTNGAALTDKVIDKLLAAFDGRRHEIWLSHHGIDSTSMEFIMKLDYERATANLVRLFKRSGGRLNLKLRGAGTSLKGNITYFGKADYRAYWERVLEREGIDPATVDVDAFLFHDRAGTIRRTERNAHLNKIGRVREIGPANPFHCWRVDQWIHILYDGRIRMCCMDYHGETALPSLADMSLVEYFQSDPYSNLVGMVTGQVESPDDFLCKRCENTAGC
ncbi:MAG: SPASM domain-containing protein [Deltaproteobacteria bacterium]|nr:SPASM domain-containing protein [Deltaproteobacteria bacterium]